VKPNISTQRTTIILRDIDSSATKEVKWIQRLVVNLGLIVVAADTLTIIRT
jgi:hypothetical protein